MIPDLKNQSYRIQAFTLLELLVVMTIIVIIIAVGAPVFFTLGRSLTIDTEVRNMAANLSLARQWAITRKEKVTFQWTQTNYSVIGERSGIIFSTNISSDVKINSADNFIFNTKGEGSVMGPKTIEITEKNVVSPKTKKITIYHLTGGYRVE